MLPAEVTSFVGRRREVADLRRLLSSSRLVTLVGLGGVGKTRLATRAAVELGRTFRDGVLFVGLDALTDPALLPHTVAAACGLRDDAVEPTDRLAEFLGGRHTLLVLDNCEHLSDACAVIIGKLLAAAPSLRILATSRQRLGVEGEHLLAVLPLSVRPAGPDEGASDPSGFAAVTLFDDRAAAVSPGFSVSDANRPLVERICQRLDGLPLAIELAAVWVRVLSLTELYERLDNQFTLLAAGPRTVPPRQRSLDAMVKWSYQLCSIAERMVWERLSVFRGGFGLPAAEAVCVGDGIERDQLLSLLAGLVDKSILLRAPGSYGEGARYQMLGVLAEFGATRLKESGRSGQVSARYRDYYRGLARAYAEHEFSEGQLERVAGLQCDLANLRQSLALWIAEGDTVAAMECSSNLTTFWIAGGLLAEGCEWLDRSLGQGGRAIVERARALHAWLILRSWLGVHTSFRKRLGEYRQVVTALGEPAETERFRACEGIVAYYRGSVSEAQVLLDEVAPAFRSRGDNALTAQVLVYLTLVKLITDAPDAGQIAEECAALCEVHGRPLWFTALSLWTLGLTEWQHQNIGRARKLQRDAIRLRAPLRDHSGIALSMEALAWCAASAEEFAEAAQLLGAASIVWRLSGAGRIDQVLREISEQQCANAARRAMGPDDFEQAYSRGAALDLDRAVALALGEQPAKAAVPGTVAPKPGGLTRRESQIAALVADGLSNKQIAARLVIAQRTAETHVENILMKLGYTSRSQIAAWHAAGRNATS